MPHDEALFWVERLRGRPETVDHRAEARDEAAVVGGELPQRPRAGGARLQRAGSIGVIAYAQHHDASGERQRRDDVPRRRVAMGGTREGAGGQRGEAFPRQLVA